ncbi:MAG: VOC family protein [Gemmatimonadetes bacterium]|nr:VOC family protein [Gemmatimonadota bacterium]
MCAVDTRLPDDASIVAVRLRVADRNRSVAFYADLLGLEPAAEDGGAVLLSAGGPPILALQPGPGIRHRPAGTLGLYHVAILHADRATLALSVRRLLAENWPFQGFSDHGVSEAAYLADPDGNGLELYADRPRATWRRAGRIAMTTLPLDLPDLLAEAGGRNWDGAAPRTRIGHVHYHVADLAKAEQFWAQAIGFDVVTREYPGALFLAAGGYHHHVAVNTWSMQRRTPGDDIAGLIDVTLRVTDAAARAGVRERLEAIGVAVQTTADGMRLQRFWRAATPGPDRRARTCGPAQGMPYIAPL